MKTRQIYIDYRAVSRSEFMIEMSVREAIAVARTMRESFPAMHQMLLAMAGLQEGAQYLILKVD